MLYEVTNEPIKNITIDWSILSRSKKSTEDPDFKQGIKDLASNIKRHGLIQPIGIIPIKYKQYKLVFGLRRLLACKMSGMKTIKAGTHI